MHGGNTRSDRVSCTARNDNLRHTAVTARRLLLPQRRTHPGLGSPAGPRAALNCGRDHCRTAVRYGEPLRCRRPSPLRPRQTPAASLRLQECTPPPLRPACREGLQRQPSCVRRTSHKLVEPFTGELGSAGAPALRPLGRRHSRSSFAGCSTLETEVVSARVSKWADASSAHVGPKNFLQVVGSIGRTHID